MNKIMALDVGTKRIGVALSDFLQIIAQPCEAIPRKPENQAVEKIKKICSENYVETIVVGLPKNMNNTVGEQAQDCILFAGLLKNDFSIIYEDERLTSWQAEENLKNRGIKYTKNKALVDIESACIILQQYLDRKDTNNG